MFFRSRREARLNAELVSQTKAALQHIARLELAIAHAKVDGDPDHAASLFREIKETRANLQRVERKVRESRAGLDITRNDVVF